MTYIDLMKQMSKRSHLHAAIAFAACLFSHAAHADDEFDYFVLALSWAPSWCALEGDDRDARQCDPSEDAAFTLHGLWPQYEISYPEYCRTSHRDPSRRETRRQADLFGSSGAAWYQWKKHGRCAGLDPADYYTTARAAFEMIDQPQIFQQIDEEISVAPSVIEEAFLEQNNTLTEDGITITCKSNHILEARICLTKELAFRKCGADVRRDCDRSSARFPPIR